MLLEILKIIMKMNDDCEKCEGYKLGQSGCGLCSLKDLENAGVTHLKVVGRGNLIQNIERDVKGLKKALYILDNSENYKKDMKNELFPNGCGGVCYYLD